jgi:hypothetical protein
MAGDLPNGRGTVVFRYEGGRKTTSGERKSLFYLADEDGNVYGVRKLLNQHPDRWFQGGNKGQVLRLTMPGAGAGAGGLDQPLVIVIADEPEPVVEDLEAEEEYELEELPPSLAPELTGDMLEAVELFMKLKPVEPTVAENDTVAVRDLTNYLIGEMAAMRLDVDNRERVGWATFMLHHHMRVRLDKELGRSITVDSRRRWPDRFNKFRKLYEEAATTLLQSQGMYGPYDVPDFAENAHDELHPYVLEQRAMGVLSPDRVVRAIACKAAGVRSTEDMTDVIVALCLQFCRRHVYDLYFVFVPDTRTYNADFTRFITVLHEVEDWRAEERLRLYLDDYEERLAHPKPRGMEAFHPMALVLRDEEQASEFNTMEAQHEQAQLEVHRLFAEDERQALATLHRERQRTVQKDKEELEESPRQRKLPSATPQGSPTNVDALICWGLQRLMSRVMGEVEEHVAPKPSSTTTAIPVVPTLANVKANVAAPAAAAVVVVKVPTCAVCGTPDAAARCPKCKIAYYCNVDCQAEHWYAGHEVACPGLL